MKKIHILILCFITYIASAENPRILIVYQQGNQFTPQELVESVDAHLLCAKGDLDYEGATPLANDIDALDLNNENHRILLDCLETTTTDFEKRIGWLGFRVSYDLVHITDMELEQAVEAIKEKEKEIPLTDEALPRVSALVAGQLYDLMIKVDCLLKVHNLTYWATCGTLLGAVRHYGLIPWDDDLDVAMFAHDMPKLLALKDELQQMGLDICLHGIGFYKIFARDGEQIKIPEEFAEYFPDEEYFSWRYPFVDIFPMQLAADKTMRYSADRIRKVCPNDYFLPHELLAPFIQMPFGPMYLPVPQNAVEILERIYGKQWSTIAYAEYDHRNEQYRKKIKVALTDRTPVAYVLPV